jgi:hypothetical protein
MYIFNPKILNSWNRPVIPYARNTGFNLWWSDMKCWSAMAIQRDSGRPCTAVCTFFPLDKILIIYEWNFLKESIFSKFLDNVILVTNGYSHCASWTMLFSPMGWTVAKSAPGHYSHYWTCSPWADQHKLLLVKSWFLCNKFVYILNTQVLTLSVRVPGTGGYK